jgi:uncharacterized protein YcsI (UPF0317 family)
MLNLSENYKSLRDLDKDQLRSAIRTSQYDGHTAGLAAGFLQANIIILPEEHALNFMRYCQRNPKPCPLVGVSETGSPFMHTLGRDIDIRSDVPRFNVYRDGELTETTTNIYNQWSDDFVVFALGCSFTFEDALVRAGLPIWHIDNNKTVPMYRSSIDTCEAGPFGGKMVVTMRAVDADRVDEAIEISRRYPMTHGGPVHVGDPTVIGLTDLSKPDWGDCPAPVGSKIPVFWACGVTPQNAIMRAKLPISISHTPGHMLITDIDDQAEVPVLIQPKS